MVTCNGLERQIYVLNPDLEVGEPLGIRMVVRKPDDLASAEFIFQASMQTDIRILLIPPSGQPYRYQGVNTGTTISTSTRKLDDTLRFTRVDSWLVSDPESLTGAAFDLVGTYRMRVEINCREKGAQEAFQHMGDFEITVSEATGDNAKALEILDDYRIYEALQIQQTRIGGEQRYSDEQIAKIEHVIEEAPNAGIQPHAQMTMFNHYAVTGRGPEAILLAGELQSQHPGTPYYELGFFLKLAALARVPGSLEAWKHFRRGWQDPLISSRIEPDSKLWGTFVAPFKGRPPNNQWMILEKPNDTPPEIERGPQIRLAEDFTAELVESGVFEGIQ